MNRTNLKFFASAISNAALSRRAAINLELAVGFAVHMDCNQAKRLSRALLCEIYASAGYQSSKPGDRDWKAINRRITGALCLFDFIGAEDVQEWINGKAKMDLVNAIVTKLEPMKLKSINEVLEICGKVAARQPRGERQHPEGTHVMDTPHIHVVVPPSATPAELMDLAMQLMALAREASEAAAPAPADLGELSADELAEEPAAA